MQTKTILLQGRSRQGESLSQRTHLLRVDGGKTMLSVMPSLPRDLIVGSVVGASVVRVVAVGSYAATCFSFNPFLCRVDIGECSPHRLPMYALSSLHQLSDKWCQMSFDVVSCDSDLGGMMLRKDYLERTMHCSFECGFRREICRIFGLDAPRCCEECYGGEQRRMRAESRQAVSPRDWIDGNVGLID